MGKRGPKAKSQPNKCPKCNELIISWNMYRRYNHKHGTCEACRAKIARNIKSLSSIKVD